MRGRAHWLALAAIVAASLTAPSGATASTAQAHLGLDGVDQSALLAYLDTSDTENHVTLSKAGNSMSLRDPGVEISVPSWAGPDTNTYCSIATGQIQCQPPRTFTSREFFVSLQKGDDTVSSNAGGAFFGGRGDDELLGGSFMVGGPGADDFVGVSTSPPTAMVDYAQGYPTEAGVTVTLDDVANDGHEGEGDNVHTSVARVHGTHAGSDTITGNVYANAISSSGGDDRIYGGGRKDHLDGGAGADVIRGGRGKDDFLNGSWGDDVLFSRDGQPDRLDCGDGVDRAKVDSIDTAIDCEIVQAG